MQWEEATFLADLETLVMTDSYSRDPEGVARVADFLAGRFTALGWHVDRRDLGSAAGPALVITNRPSTRYEVLLLAHMDTVFAPGTTAERPFRVEGRRAYGPGVNDMKSGLLMTYYVAQALTDELGDASIAIVMVPDEEIGSVASRGVVEELARQSAYCLVLESARASGNMVNERKGIGDYRVIFHGKAAHAAVGPENGADAIRAAGLLMPKIYELASPAEGTTVLIGTIAGGTTPNSVAARAEFSVDIRLVTAAEGARVDAAMQALAGAAAVDGVTIEVTGGIVRPPMPLTDDTVAFCKAIDAIQERLGITAAWEASGGGSDGNLVAPFGVPTVDGCGPVGGFPHSPDEYLELDSLAPRFALVVETVCYCLANPRPTYRERQ